MQKFRENTKPGDSRRRSETIGEFSEEELAHFDIVRDETIKKTLDILCDIFFKNKKTVNIEEEIERIVQSNLTYLKSDREGVVGIIKEIVLNFFIENRENGTFDALLLEHYTSVNKEMILGMYSEVVGILGDKSNLDPESGIANVIVERNIPLRIAQYILPVILSEGKQVPELQVVKPAPLLLTHNPDITILESPEIDAGGGRVVDPGSVLSQVDSLERQAREILGRPKMLSERGVDADNALSLEGRENNFMVSADNFKILKDGSSHFLIMNDLVNVFLKPSGEYKKAERKRIIEDLGVVFMEFLDSNKNLLLAIVQTLNGGQEREFYLKDMDKSVAEAVTGEVLPIVIELLGKKLGGANSHLHKFLQTNDFSTKDKFLGLYFLVVRILLDKNSAYYERLKKENQAKEYGEGFFPDYVYTVVNYFHSLKRFKKDKIKGPSFHEKYSTYVHDKLKNFDFAKFGIVVTDYRNLESNDKDLVMIAVRGLIKAYLRSGIKRKPILFNTGFDTNYKIQTKDGILIDGTDKEEEYLIDNFVSKYKIPGDGFIKRIFGGKLNIEEIASGVLMEFIKENIVYDPRIFI